MDENARDTEPLVTQIVEKTLAALSERAEFDEETVRRLRTLASSGDLKNKAQVVAALKASEKKDNEDSQA